VSITTTDALFAPKVQRKVSNAVAGLAAAGLSLDRREIAASGLFSLPIAEFESDQPGILNSPAVMLFGLPRRQRLPKSLPQLHIRHTAAQTRTVSTAQFQPNPRKLWRQFKWILFLTDSGVRVRYAQPGSRLKLGGTTDWTACRRASRLARRELVASGICWAVMAAPPCAKRTALSHEQRRG
jgi:hypothetical protein